MRKNSLLKTLAEYVVIIVLAIVCALAVKRWIAESYIVPSGSMLETIHEGDRLIGEKISYYTKSPKAGDVVTFLDPEDPSVTLIKRVIATEGQTIDLKDGVVYVDGVAQNEDYTLGKPSYPLTMSADPQNPVTFPYTVPAGYIWVMGDNRTNSLDSRYFGAVPVSSVTSRAIFIYWPPSDIRGL